MLIFHNDDDSRNRDDKNDLVYKKLVVDIGKLKIIYPKNRNKTWVRSNYIFTEQTIDTKIKWIK